VVCHTLTWYIRAQVTTIEFSLVEASILHGLKQGNAVLAEIHKEMNIEGVERLMGETQEAIAYQQVWQYLVFLMC
jgi:Snf7